MLILPFNSQRQTAVSQFFQLDRLVVEGQRTVSLLLLLFAASFGLTRVPAQGKQTGHEGDIVRQVSDQGS